MLTVIVIIIKLIPDTIQFLCEMLKMSDHLLTGNKDIQLASCVIHFQVMVLNPGVVMSA